jgi:hypothetical protein
MTTAYSEEASGYAVHPDVDLFVIERHVEFDNPSEEEFARLLDFYQIAWRHKPRTFAVEWDDEGNFVSSFTPAFYLTEYDLYIELLTFEQERVAGKNRKVRLLKQSYPDVKIKLLNETDYKGFIEKCASPGTGHHLFEATRTVCKNESSSRRRPGGKLDPVSTRTDESSSSKLQVSLVAW